LFHIAPHHRRTDRIRHIATKMKKFNDLIRWSRTNGVIELKQAPAYWWLENHATTVRVSYDPTMT